MTQAYIRGFCKTAEAYGVDPEQLLKSAAGIPKFMRPRNLGRLLTTFSGRLYSYPQKHINSTEGYIGRLDSVITRLVRRDRIHNGVTEYLESRFPNGIPASYRDVLDAFRNSNEGLARRLEPIWDSFRKRNPEKAGYIGGTLSSSSSDFDLSELLRRAQLHIPYRDPILVPPRRNPDGSSVDYGFLEHMLNGTL